MLWKQEKLVADRSSEFAQQLRTLREAKGLSVRELATIIGVSSVTVWKWEKGNSKPRPHLIPPLAKALDVRPASLTPIVELKRAQKTSAEVEATETIFAYRGEPLGSVAGTLVTSAQPEALADVIARAKQMIAEISGSSPSNITILIEY